MLGLILLGILGFLAWYHFVKPLSYWKNQGVRQSKPWIFFGDSWVTVFRRLSLAEYVDKVYNMYPDLRYSGFYQFNIPTLVIRDIELIKQITIRDFDNFTDHKFFIDSQSDPLWGGNLFALEGIKWREMRATLSRIFTSSKIKNMFVLMEKSAETFVQFFLNKRQDLLEVDVKDICARYTTDVIATTAFGIEVDSLNEPNNAFYRLGKDITQFDNISTLIKIIGNLIMPKVLRMLNISVFSKESTTFFKNVINETIRTREEKGIVRPDLINLLIETRKGHIEGDESDINEATNMANFRQYKKITNDDIASQAFVFFFGGFDTISTVLVFGCYEMAFNKDIQDKLRKEIRKTHEETNGKLSYDSVLQMKYLDMVVSEVLRIWTPGIFLDRVCTKPYTIEPTTPDEVPVHLREGDVLWIPVYGIQRNPSYYQNPSKFDPERFSDENKDRINSYTYMPFGLGPRNCIGNRFALLEIKVLLFNLLLNFEIVSTEKTTYPIKLSKKSMIPAPERLLLGLQRIKH